MLVAQAVVTRVTEVAGTTVLEVVVISVVVVVLLVVLALVVPVVDWLVPIFVLVVILYV